MFNLLFVDKIPDCIPHPTNPLTCFIITGDQSWTEADQMCSDLQGILPRPISVAEGDAIWTIGGGSELWTGLVTEDNP